MPAFWMVQKSNSTKLHRDVGNRNFCQTGFQSMDASASCSHDSGHLSVFLLAPCDHPNLKQTNWLRATGGSLNFHAQVGESNLVQLSR